MNGARNTRFSLRRCALTGVGAALALAAVNAAGAATPSQAPQTAANAAACGCVYSVINLDSDGAIDLLNEKGQAALQSFVFGTRRFFDGDRLHDIGALGPDNYTVIRGLNDLGVVVGESSDNTGPFGQVRAFAWTVGGGMRVLPGFPYASAYAINNRNQIVGYMHEPDLTARAVRWDPTAKVLDLGPAPFSLSEAHAINERGAAAGFFDTVDQIHAAYWDPARRQTDLGTLGGQLAFASFINERDEVAGYSDNATGTGQVGFFWSARDGVVPTGAATSNGTLVNDLNDLGELVGETGDPDASQAYIWSRARGLRLLPHGPVVDSRVLDINNKSEMVGVLEPTRGDTRAVLWKGVTTPIDLNTRLYRAPAGLVLQGGRAINEAGDILAWSNAGMVMLRPGTRGTDAPVLGPILGLPYNVTIGQDVDLTLGFVDNDPRQSHTVTASWTDNCKSTVPVVAESGGVGRVTQRHRFCAAGYYFVTIRVADSGGRVTDMERDFVVNAPGVAAIGGKGTLARTPGRAGARAAPLHFALWAPLATTAGAGASARPLVRFDGPFQFRADEVASRTRNGRQVHLEGSGRLNGHPGYRFAVDATHGDDGDRMHVRVTHADAAGAQVVDYDNGTAPATALAAAPGRDATRVVEGGVSLHD